MKKITDYKPREYGDNPIAFFHYLDDDGEIKYQGFVKELTPEFTGSVVFFSWLDSCDTDEACVTSAFFDQCIFYNSDYEMRNNKK
jgi:hypothetical protein